MTFPTTARASYRRSGEHWVGAIRDGTRLLWTCPHTHQRRDWGYQGEGTQRFLYHSAAWECAKSQLDGTWLEAVA